MTDNEQARHEKSKKEKKSFVCAIHKSAPQKRDFEIWIHRFLDVTEELREKYASTRQEGEEGKKYKRENKFYMNKKSEQDFKTCSAKCLLKH